MSTRAESVAEYFVMVPFYDNVEYLRDTLRSVLAQSDPHWRAIIVDDSPTDRGVAALVDELGDPRISSIRNAANLGVAGAFNRCFELAAQSDAELAMILHADDLLERDYISTVRAAHAACPTATCVTTKVSVIGANGNERRTMPDTVKGWLWPRGLASLEGERGLQLLLRGQFFYCPAVSYRMGLLALPAWNPRWTQVMDLELYGRILSTGGSIVLEPKRVFRYRRHEQSMTNLNSVTLVRTVEETEVCRMLATEAQRLGWKRAAREGRWRVTVRLQSLMRFGSLLIRGQFRAASRAFVLSVRP
jgi:glycosyltransferase involved in cell wall biosynthesis